MPTMFVYNRAILPFSYSVPRRTALPEINAGQKELIYLIWPNQWILKFKSGDRCIFFSYLGSLLYFLFFIIIFFFQFQVHLYLFASTSFDFLSSNYLDYPL